jgi:hypothetical protein
MDINEFDSRVCSHRAGLIRKYGVCEPIPFVRDLDMGNKYGGRVCFMG